MNSQDKQSTEKKDLNINRTKNMMIDIKSKYIITKIFHTIQTKKFLEIIKYNKAIQKKLDLKINDYIQYSGLYSFVEVEIIPIKNKNDNFINIDEDDENFFHIYFNNNKEEIKRTYITKGDNITKINIIIDYPVKSFYKLFYNCKCIESLYFKKFTRNNIQNMGGMFFGCSSLKVLDITKFKTTNITNMRSMFYGCSSLKELNLSNFNTDNIIDMSYMFKGCSSLKELNLSNINISKITNINNMFIGCSSLINLNLTNFNILVINNISSMFNGCPEELKMKIKSQFKNIKEEIF